MLVRRIKVRTDLCSSLDITEILATTACGRGTCCRRRSDGLVVLVATPQVRTMTRLD